MLRLALGTAILLISASALADIGKEAAAHIAQQQTRGKVLSVDKQQSDYRIKVLKDNGQVVILLVNADNGAVH